MPISVSIDLRTLEATGEDALKRVKLLGNEAARKTLVEAGAAGLVNCLKRHFKAREAEAPSNAGFPRFGQAFPKRYFWYGSRGTSVAERIRTVDVSTAGLSATVEIDSKELAHKLAATPPPIVPKGGRKRLAIPANPSAAGWAGRARDFPGKLRPARVLSPSGRVCLALVLAGNGAGGARGNGSRSAKGSLPYDPSYVAYWLVRKVFTRHDPRALPSESERTKSVLQGVKTALARLLR